MCRVANNVRRKDTSGHDSFRQRLGVIGDCQSREPADDREAFFYFRWVAGGGFVDDDLRDRAIKLTPPIRPPLFLRGLLVAGHNHVTAWTSDQVADERRFQVDRFHGDLSFG